MLAFAFPAGAAAPAPSFAHREAEIMATRIAVDLPDGPEAERLAQTVFATFREVEATMNEWKAGSPLAEVNRHAGVQSVAVPTDLLACLRAGVEISRRSGGAFSVTWAALWGLWDFRAPHPVPPDPARIAARLPLIDDALVEIDEAAGTVGLPRPGMVIGLGGIAKGWALDRAGAALRTSGLRDFLISAGGQILAAGHSPSGQPWRVGVRDPRGVPEDWFVLVEAKDASVSTSGDYERFFLHEGRRYHHILDPKTGMPSVGLRAATVIAPDATLADGLSTAVMVLGADRGLALVAGYPGVEVVMVDGKGQVLTSPGLAGELVLRHPPSEAEGEGVGEVR